MVINILGQSVINGSAFAGNNQTVKTNLKSTINTLIVVMDLITSPQHSMPTITMQWRNMQVATLH